MEVYRKHLSTSKFWKNNDVSRNPQKKLKSHYELFYISTKHEKIWKKIRFECNLNRIIYFFDFSLLINKLLSWFTRIFSSIFPSEFQIYFTIIKKDILWGKQKRFPFFPPSQVLLFYQIYFFHLILILTKRFFFPHKFLKGEIGFLFFPLTDKQHYEKSWAISVEKYLQRIKKFQQ